MHVSVLAMHVLPQAFPVVQTLQHEPVDSPQAGKLAVANSGATRTQAEMRARILRMANTPWPLSVGSLPSLLLLRS